MKSITYLSLILSIVHIIPVHSMEPTSQTNTSTSPSQHDEDSFIKLQAFLKSLHIKTQIYSDSTNKSSTERDRSQQIDKEKESNI